MFWHLMRIAARNLWRSKLFSVINIFGFAFGLAGFALILLHVTYELSYDRFHEKGNRLYLLTEEVNWGNGWGETWQTAAPIGPAMRDEFPEVEQACRLTPWFSQTMQVEQQKYVERIWFGDPSVFDMFTIPLLHGEAGKALENPNTITLSTTAAHKYFGESDPIGQTILWNESFPLEVVGVFEDIPENSYLNFEYLISNETLNSPALLGNDLDNWRPHNFYNYLLLTEDADLESLTARFPELMVRHYGADANEHYRPELRPMVSLHLSGDYRQIKLLGSIALFILLIAVVNYMNLSTARATRRAREIGIRKVMGSRRGELIRQFMGEAFLVSLSALLVALLLTELLLPWFRSLTGNELVLEQLFAPAPLMVMIAIFLLSSVLAGLYPAFYLSGFLPAEVLKSGRLPHGKGANARKVLVTVQFALSIALILATLTVKQQHQHMMRMDLGFDSEHILYLPLQSSELAGNAESFRDRVLLEPGVRSASVMSRLFGRISGGVWGLKKPGMEDDIAMYTVFTDWHFLETMGVELVQGRGFEPDYPTDTREAFLLNEKAMEKLGIDWNGDRQVELPSDDRSGEVVGVIKDFHFQSLYHGNNAVAITFLRDTNYDRRFLAVRVAPGMMDTVVPRLKALWYDYDPALAFDVHFLDRLLESQYKKEQRLSSILSWFSGFTIFVALLGLFGLSTFMTQQRTREIGVRKVLGASVPGILLLLGKDFAKPVLFANLIAWPTAFLFLQSWLQDYLYRIPMPYLAFFVVGFSVLLVAEATVILQAYRAAQTNPVEALRYE